MAIAIDIAQMFALIIMGALLGILFEPLGLQFLDIAAAQTTTQAATDGQNYVRAAWDVLNLLVVFFAALGLVVAAVSRRGIVR
jgi:hypothetical protein